MHKNIHLCQYDDPDGFKCIEEAKNSSFCYWHDKSIDKSGPNVKEALIEYTRSGGMTRGILVGLIVTLVSLFFVDIQIHNIWVIIATVALTSATFALGGLINAIFANSFDDISIIPTFVLTPLIYLGGVFYSINILPDIWRNISMANPMLYVVNTFREGMLGVSDVSIPFALSMIVLFIVLLSSACLYLLNKGIGIRQ